MHMVMVVVMMISCFINYTLEGESHSYFVNTTNGSHCLLSTPRMHSTLSPPSHRLDGDDDDKLFLKIHPVKGIT